MVLTRSTQSRYDRIMKLLLDARMAFPPSHGIARYTMNLIRGLKGHANLHLLVSSAEAKNFFTRETPWVTGYHQCRVPFANPLDALELSLVIPNIFDLVHFTSFSVPLKLPKRSVITIHDLIHLKEDASFLHKLYYKSVVKHGVKNCSSLIAVSQWTKNDLVQQYKINEDKVAVIPNGLESMWFADTPAVPSEQKFRESRGLRVKYICCVSNLKAHKNLKTLLAACNQLWNDGKNFELALVVGQESLPETFDLNPLFRPRVRLLTKLSEPELMALYRYAQLTVSPSRYEGYCLPVAESLAMKTPTVLSQASAHQEFKGPGIHFYAPYDSSYELAKKIAAHLDKKDKIPGVPENVLDQNEMARQTLEVYRKAMTRTV